MNGRGIGLPALLPGPLLAAGCQSGPDMLAAPVMGSNHTSAAINLFSVNGAGGPRLDPYQGDGSQVCWSDSKEVESKFESCRGMGERSQTARRYKAR